jgi:tRNA (adenine57-N1/adenine58-N1)-methyltransferase
LRLRDIGSGFEEKGVPSLFLDLPNPYDYLPQVRAALSPGGFLGAILPTTNQVSLLLSALERNQFAFVEVCEISLRYYKPIAERLRPTDRMVAHTGFLIFARPVIEPENGGQLEAAAPEEASTPDEGEFGPEPEG